MEEISKKIKLLVIAPDQGGVMLFRSTSPHIFIQNNFGDRIHVDIIFPKDMPVMDLSSFLMEYDIIQIHSCICRSTKLIELIRFLDIPLVIDIDDYYLLGPDHPMYFMSRKEQIHIPIMDALKKADYVTTTTPIYAKELRKLNKNVAIFPNTVDPTDKQFSTEKNPNPSGMLRVGIICGSTHLKDIELLSKVYQTTSSGKVQIELCGFDTNGTNTLYGKDGTKKTVPISPYQTTWYQFEKILTNNYQTISPAHKDFLLKFIPNIDDPFTNEPYRRFWTKDISKYANHYKNVDVLLAPLKENMFNKMKSELKEIECGYTNTAIIAQNFGAYSINLTNFNKNQDPNATSILIDSSKNHKDWNKSINLLVQHPEYVELLKNNLSNFVRKTYPMMKIAEARVELYEKICKNKNK